MPANTDAHERADYLDTDSDNDCVPDNDPREAGAAMLVTADDASGTIGGGHLEYKAIEFARECIAARQTLATRRHFPLGPALGQCCGGAVELTFVPVQAADRADWQRLADTAERGGRFQWSLPLDSGGVAALDLAFTPWHVWVFGAGHVGRAIVQVLAALPCRVTWVDSREEPFPAALPAGVRLVATDDPAREAARIEWLRYPTQIEDVSFDLDDFHIRWFADGELNVATNCLDRHLATRGDKTAILFEPDDPKAAPRRISYRELHAEVGRAANALRA